MTVNELIKQLQEKFVGTEEINFETNEGNLYFDYIGYNRGVPTMVFEVEEFFEE